MWAGGCLQFDAGAESHGWMCEDIRMPFVKSAMSFELTFALNGGGRKTARFAFSGLLRVFSADSLHRRAGTMVGRRSKVPRGSGERPSLSLRE